MTTRNVANTITWGFRRVGASFVVTAGLDTANGHKKLNRVRPAKLRSAIADTDSVPVITGLAEQATVFKTAVEEAPSAIPLGPPDHLG